jgi:ferredoxin
MAGKVRTVEFDLIDVTREKSVDLDPYDVVGFATFTDFLGVPYLFQSFIEELPEAEGRPAFVFNTYGFISGKTLRIMEELVRERRYKVVAGHTLHTPESYPPQILRGLGAEKAPSDREMARFEGFVTELARLLGEAEAGREVRSKRSRIGMLNSMIPRFPRTRSREDMGEKRVDEELCIECGKCERVCPYGAIKLAPEPVFDEQACYGCWGCYNHCPEGAIHTAKLRGEGRYPGPNEQLREKLRV